MLCGIAIGRAPKPIESADRPSWVSGKLDGGKLLKTRRIAAEQSTSVNALVRDFLDELIERESKTEAARRQLVALYRESKVEIRSMTADCLLDTKVLVYAVDGTPGNRADRDSRLWSLRAGPPGVLRHRNPQDRNSPDAGWCPSVSRSISVDHDLVVEYIRNSVKFQLSYWDGAILAATERLGASFLFSEDLNYGPVEVRNPFLG